MKKYSTGDVAQEVANLLEWVDGETVLRIVRAAFPDADFYLTDDGELATDNDGFSFTDEYIIKKKVASKDCRFTTNPI